MEALSMSEDMEAIRVMGFWRWAWARTGCYRGFNRLMHRFEWHHMRPMPIIEPDHQQIRCDWCGAWHIKYIGRMAIPSAPDTGDVDAKG
jgi:hypothetical protein